MKSPLLLLLVVFLAGGVAWLVVTDVREQSDYSDSAGPGGIRDDGTPWEGALESDAAEGPDVAVHERAVGDLLTDRLPIEKGPRGYSGAEMLRVMRQRVRVVFKPKELAGVFERGVYGEHEDFGADGLLGGDLARIIAEDGYLVDDRGGVMEISRTPAEERMDRDDR